MDEREYVSKINGYFVKDLDSRNLLTMYGNALEIVNNNVTRIQQDYLDLTKILEIDLTITPTDTNPTSTTEYLPEGYNPENTICLYKYVYYTLSGGNTHIRRFDDNNFGVSISETVTEGHEIAPEITAIITGSANTTYHVVVGLIKIENSEESEGE